MNPILSEISDLLVGLEKDDWFCLPGSRDAFGSAVRRRLQSGPEPGFITGSGEGVCSLLHGTKGHTASHPAWHPL